MLLLMLLLLLLACISLAHFSGDYAECNPGQVFTRMCLCHQEQYNLVLANGR